MDKKFFSISILFATALIVAGLTLIGSTPDEDLDDTHVGAICACKEMGYSAGVGDCSQCFSHCKNHGGVKMCY